MTAKELPTWQDQGGGVKRRIVADGEKLMLVQVHFEKDAEGTLHSHPHEQAAIWAGTACKVYKVEPIPNY